MRGGYVGFDFFAESLLSFAKKDWEDCCRFREAEPCKKQEHLITQHALSKLANPSKVYFLKHLFKPGSRTEPEPEF